MRPTWEKQACAAILVAPKAGDHRPILMETTMSDQKKTEDFTKSLRSSATLLLRTLDRLQFDYSETSARELSERVSLLAQLDGLENRENPIPMAYLRERVRLLQAYEKFSGDWSIRDLKNQIGR